MARLATGGGVGQWASHSKLTQKRVSFASKRLTTLRQGRSKRFGNNGGPTRTHALTAASPAIDTGDNASCLATDQRGAIRPVDGDGNATVICDKGAYEYNAAIPIITVYLPIVTAAP